MTGIVASIIHAMSPTTGAGAGTPIANAGAAVVENHQVTQITIVTNYANTVVMDQGIARQLRDARTQQNLLEESDALQGLSAPVAGMLRAARRGDLSGETSLEKGELHFRPDGYRYWVPVEENPVTANGALQSGGRYRVSGHIALSDSQPDRIVVDHAVPIGG